MAWQHRGMLRPWPAVGWLAALISLLIHGGPVAVNAVPTAAAGSFRRAAAPTADAPSSNSADELSDEDGSDDADTDEADDGPALEQAAPGTSRTTTAAPEAVSLGPNGYPQLPSVSNIFGAASRTLQAIAEQAKMLQGRATSAGQADEARLGREKQVYERKLKHQEQQNRKLADSVAQTKARIKALELNNAAIKNHSIALQKSNELMRKELTAIEQRLRVSQDFAARALETTDDSMVKELEVLQHQNVASGKSVEDADSDADDAADGDADDNDSDDDVGNPTAQISQKPTSRSVGPSSQPVAQQIVAAAPPPSKEQPSAAKNLIVVQQARKVNSQEDTEEDGEEDDDRDGDDADDDSDDDADYDEDEDEDNITDTKTSFLALGTKRTRTRSRLRMTKVEAPAATEGRSLIADIDSNIQALADQEKQSQTHLHDTFEAAWKAGEQRHAALIEEWGMLNATEKTLLAVQGRLKTAEAHLRNTQSQLEEHLRAEGLFTQRLAHLALAPSSEAPRLLEAVPDHVALPALSKKVTTPKKATALVRMSMPTVEDPTPA